MSILANAGDKKICPLCGEGLKKVTSNKGNKFIKCSKNGFLEENKATNCDFMFDTTPAILRGQKNVSKELTDTEVLSILNGDVVIKGAGMFFIDGKPDIVEDKRYWLHYTFKEALIEDF